MQTELNSSQNNTSDTKTPPPLTPMMVQWQACKQAAGDALLLFRLGDFYEAFHEDALLLAKEADLTLTKRQEIPMSGIPHHTAEGYIEKLVEKGYKVAIAEQVEDKNENKNPVAKGIVKREVTKIITPATIINSSYLESSSNNFFASINQVGSLFGLSFLDLATSEFYVIEVEDLDSLLNEIFRISPSEILISKKFKEKHPLFFNEIKKNLLCLVSEIDNWHFDHQVTYPFLTTHFKVHNLDGFGLKGMIPGVNAAGALLNYLNDSLCLTISHVHQIMTLETSEFMSLDRISERNLELTTSLTHKSKKNSLLDILDKTETPMGGRCMRQLIKKPLLSVSEITKRQDAIDCFLKKKAPFYHLKALFSEIKDLERLMMKISSGLALPRDLIALKCSFQPIHAIKKVISEHFLDTGLIRQEYEKIEELPDMLDLIEQSIVDEPPAKIGDGGVFKLGFNSELDKLLLLSQDSKSWVTNYQLKLREETGIKTLKVGFTRIFGYYIEVSKGQADKMPESFQRRQTLVNGERYVTPELKTFEREILTAEERISKIEQDLFFHLRASLAVYGPQVQKIAKALALLDALLALAEVALVNNYKRPLVDDSLVLKIEEGRHPVIEVLNQSQKFVPNDTLLGDDQNKLLLITGPNMAGKSTYIRQVALLCIMAQIGSFIPVKSAHIGVIDKVFTRIGANDDLAKGQSTFMVEMSETANILNNVTDKSLVILDEIGRGTSTYDGISIAWSVAEYLLTTENKQAKTLFATHYFELTKLEEKIPGAVNYSVAVNECGEEIIFLHKIVKGGTDKSYGIHVARLAGLPLPAIKRAQEILVHLEENANRKGLFEPPVRQKKGPIRGIKEQEREIQLTLFS